jgi:hypothetical protein
MASALLAGYTVEDLGPLGNAEDFSSGSHSAGQLMVVGQFQGRWQTFLPTPEAEPTSSLAARSGEAPRIETTPALPCRMDPVCQSST